MVDPYGGFREQVEDELERVVRRVFREQRGRLVAELGNKPGVEPDEAFWQSEQEVMIAALRPTLQRAAQLAASAHGARAKALPVAVDEIDGPLLPTGVPILWDEAVIAADAVHWATNYAYELIRGINDNTRGVVREAVRAFTETPGMTIGELTQILEPAFGEMRAHRIAVTETTRAFTQGQRSIQRELQRGGLNLERVWRSSMDELVCPICGALEDKRESAGWGGYEPPAHPNCRCWTELVL